MTGAGEVEAETWSSGFMRRVAEELRFWRERRGYSAGALAERTAAMGSEVSRSVISNFEVRRRAQIGLDEFLILAAALDVPPMVLLTGIGRRDSVEAQPGVEVSPTQMQAWVAGVMPLAREDVELPAWRDAAQRISVYAVHQEMVEDCERVQDRVRRVAAMVADTGEAHGLLAQVADDLSRAASALLRWREYMQGKEMMAAPLPPRVSSLLGSLTDRLSGGLAGTPERGGLS